MASSNPVPPPQSGSSWAALAYTDFRWMYVAQFVSYIGASMQLAAVNWHIYTLTGNLVALGSVGLVRVVPIIALSLLGGVVADAVDRRKLMLWTQVAMLVFAAVLALATLSGAVTLPLIYAMTAALSGAAAFDSPAWSALMPNLVPGRQLANAVRLNVVLHQLTSVVGPMIAGLVLGALGPGVAYTVNALTFIPVIAALLLIHVKPIVAAEKGRISLAALFEGLRFIRQSPMLWSSMLLDFFATFFSSALALLPVYASDILKVGAQGYGILYAAPSFGSAFGALTMAQYAGRIRRMGETMLAAVAAYGLATVVFGVSQSFWLSLVALAATGLADSVSTVIRNSLRQLLTPDRLRGRMLSVNMIFFMGGPQLGEFEAGLLAHAVSTPFSVIFGGVATLLVVGAVAASVPTLRRYREIPLPSGEAAVGETPEEAPSSHFAAAD